MGRPLRHVPPGGSRFEITTRCLQSRYLLPTDEDFRRLAVGIIARAKARYPVELYAFGGLRTHLHFLLGVEEVSHLSDFMGYVNGNLAREAGRMVGWDQKFWGHRFHAIPVSDEEAALVDRLRYLLSHGVKENLVLQCRDWPGLQCVDALTNGAPLEGIWHDRSGECVARRGGREIDPKAFQERISLVLDPLPCWRHLPDEEIQSRIREMVAEVDAQSARRLVLNGGVPLGAAAIRKQHPHGRPPRTKKSPAPSVHAASQTVRKQLREAYRLFVAAYRAAADRLRTGDDSVEFPPGCFPPPRPCVLNNNHPVSSRAGPALASG